MKKPVQGKIEELEKANYDAEKALNGLKQKQNELWQLQKTVLERASWEFGALPSGWCRYPQWQNRRI